MNQYQVGENNLESESDVEQKVLYPLMKTAEPIGLGYSPSEIRTKVSLKKLLIDKGKKEILYFPDYLIMVNGVPTIVVEAKKPGEDLVEGFRQAALYAGEDPDVLSEDETISLQSPGTVHLNMLTNVDYLSACSEDVWYSDAVVASKIADRLKERTASKPSTLKTELANATDLIAYLESYFERTLAPYETHLSDRVFSVPVEFDAIKETLENVRYRTGVGAPKLAMGTKLEGKIVRMFTDGVFVAVPGHRQWFFASYGSIADENFRINLREGDRVAVEIIGPDKKPGRYKVSVSKVKRTKG